MCDLQHKTETVCSSTQRGSSPPSVRKARLIGGPQSRACRHFLSPPRSKETSVVPERRQQQKRVPQGCWDSKTKADTSAPRSARFSSTPTRCWTRTTSSPRRIEKRPPGFPFSFAGRRAETNKCSRVLRYDSMCPSGCLRVRPKYVECSLPTTTPPRRSSNRSSSKKCSYRTDGGLQTQKKELVRRRWMLAKSKIDRIADKDCLGQTRRQRPAKSLSRQTGCARSAHRSGVNVSSGE